MLRLCLHQLSSGVSESFCERGLSSVKEGGHPCSFSDLESLSVLLREGGKTRRRGGEGNVYVLAHAGTACDSIRASFSLDFDRVRFCDPFALRLHPLMLLPLELSLFFGVSHCFEPLLMLVFLSAE